MVEFVLVVLLAMAVLPLWFVVHVLGRLSSLGRLLEELSGSIGVQLSVVRRELVDAKKRLRRLRKKTARLAHRSAKGVGKVRPAAKSAPGTSRPAPGATPPVARPDLAGPGPGLSPAAASHATPTTPDLTLPVGPSDPSAPEVPPGAPLSGSSTPDPSPAASATVSPAPAPDIALEPVAPTAANDAAGGPSAVPASPPSPPPSPEPVAVPPAPAAPSPPRRARFDPETLYPILEEANEHRGAGSPPPSPARESSRAASRPPRFPAGAAAEAGGPVSFQPLAGEPPPPPAGPSWLEQIQTSLSGEEWESVVGGSWLNKLGALILVIGLALFLRYSYAEIGPAGRAAAGYLVGFLLLGAGLYMERQDRYLVFSLGLKGGGWAALYYTSYAVHALPASRLIESPAMGMLLLVGVAAAMIAHALQYKSEPTACLAYFIGYATLVISPRSDYSLIASLPLLASLLIVSFHREWDRTPLLGLILSYGCYALGYGDVFWRPPLPDALVSGKTILAIHWLAFELYDLLDTSRGRRPVAAAQAVFPVNAVGFIGVALMHAPSGDPHALAKFLGMTGLAYLVSTGIRAWIRPPSKFEPATDTLGRALAGSYEGAVTLTTALLSVSMFLRFSGFRLIAGFLTLAEMLFITGRQARQTYLRLLGIVVYELGALYGFHLMFTIEATRELYGITMKAWTPGLLLLIVVGYLDSLLVASDPVEPFEVQTRTGFSVSATLLTLACLGFNLRYQLVGMSWMVLAAVLLEVARRSWRPEFATQAVAVFALATGALAINNLARDAGPAAWEPWVALALPAFVTGFSAWRLRFRPRANLDADFLPPAASLTADVGVGCLLALLWLVLPPGLVAVGWGLVAILAGEIGYTLDWPRLRLHLHVGLALTLGRALMANFTLLGDTNGVSHRLLTVVPLVLAFGYEWLRMREEGPAKLTGWETAWQRWLLYPPTLLLAMLLRFECGRVGMVSGWAAMTAVLVGVGRRAQLGDLRGQGYLLAALTFLRCWGTDFLPPESLPGAFDPNRHDRLITGGLVVLAFFLAQFQLPRRDEGEGSSLAGFDLRFRSVFCVMGALLLTKLIYHEASDVTLSIAWGVEAAALLGAGFALRDRPLRLSGLMLELLCILKLLVYDFRNLAPPWRILSFCLLGGLLIAISWAYTRFRDKLREFF